LRFSVDASSEHQVVAALAIQLFTLGIPCIYYGTEQALAGPEKSERQWLPEWGTAERYLREARFGPLHPRASGRAGVALGALDTTLPGFGPFGTSGRHCFDEEHVVFRRVQAMIEARASLPVLRHGRQYLRPVSIDGAPFAPSTVGGILAWSRILDDEEALCIVNTHGDRPSSADVLIDAAMNAPGEAFRVVVNTAQAADAAYVGTHPLRSLVTVEARGDVRFLAIRDLPPSEVLVLINR
jgi:hypothetical protein